MPAGVGGRGAVVPPIPPGAVGFLATAGPGGPGVIPVSALHRASDGVVLLALAPTRASLARLRADGRVALALTTSAGSATVHGTARVIADPLPGADFVVGVALRAERVQDTLGARTVVHEGVRWGWRDASSADRHVQVVDALARLAARTGEADRPGNRP